MVRQKHSFFLGGLVFFITGIVTAAEEKAAEKSAPVAKMKTVIGKVNVIQKEKSIQASRNFECYREDVIQTLEASMAILRLLLPLKGIVTVPESSKFRVEKRLEEKQNRDETILHLFSGTLRVKLDPLKKKQSFIVKTPTAVAGVRGTDFIVSNIDNKTSVAVVEGAVEVTMLDAVNKQLAADKDGVRKKTTTPGQTRTLTAGTFVRVETGKPLGQVQALPNREFNRLQRQQQTFEKMERQIQSRNNRGPGNDKGQNKKGQPQKVEGGKVQGPRLDVNRIFDRVVDRATGRSAERDRQQRTQDQNFRVNREVRRIPGPPPAPNN